MLTLTTVIRRNHDSNIKAADARRSVLRASTSPVLESSHCSVQGRPDHFLADAAFSASCLWTPSIADFTLPEARSEISIILAPAFIQDCIISTAKRPCVSAICCGVVTRNISWDARALVSRFFLTRSDQSWPTSLAISSDAPGISEKAPKLRIRGWTAALAARVVSVTVDAALSA